MIDTYIDGRDGNEMGGARGGVGSVWSEGDIVG